MSDKHTVIGQGRTLFKQGDKGGDLYFIIEGKVELTVKEAVSGNEIVVATMTDKSVIGSMSFLEGDPRSATATAKTEVKYILINQVQRAKLLASVPTWLQVLIKDLSNNIRRSNEAIAKSKTEFDILEKRYKVKEEQKTAADARITKMEKEAAELRQADIKEKEALKKQIKDLQESLSKVEAQKKK